MNHPSISVRTRFERFPATIKGAFVIRGEDRDPHQLRIRRARIVQVGGAVDRELAVQLVTVDMPPHQDLFFPFEAGVGDMDPGWYGLELEADIDGSARVFEGDRRFTVAWPRGTVRSGVIGEAARMQLGDLIVEIEKVQCSSDSTVVRLSVSPPEPVEVSLAVDGTELPILEHAFDPETGHAVVTAYPLMRAIRHLRVGAAIGDGGSRVAGDVTFDLP